MNKSTLDESFQNESWKPVVGYEETYSVSNMGRVRSEDRIDSRGWSRSSRILNPAIMAGGHHRVSLSKQGVQKSACVHRLVLAAFVGPCPDGLECCHNNGISNDNRVENLRWDTRVSNIRDSIAHGVRYNVAPGFGEKNTMAKITNKKAVEVFEASGKLIDISKSLGVPYEIVRSIKKGRRWSSVTGANGGVTQK